MKRRISVLLLCVVSTAGIAQTAGYRYYCPLDSISSSGFYSIELTPKLTSFLKTDCSDLRIVNDSGRWIPHRLYLTGPVSEEGQTPVTLRMQKTESNDNLTNIIIENHAISPPDLSPRFIDNLSLQINNTDAIRSCSISGSNDDKTWFAIKDSVLLQPVLTAYKKNMEYSVRFPGCNYHFYKLVINNKNNNPVNILSAVTYVLLTLQGLDPSAFNPVIIPSQKDSAKLSYVKFSQQRNYHFDNIQLFLSGTKYFHRKAEIYMPEAGEFDPKNPGIPLQSLYISNNSELSFSVPLSNAKEFYLLIYNSDNLPLKIDSALTSRSFRSITAYLEKGNAYRMILDNPAAVVPDYDLKSSDISNINILYAGKIMPLDTKEKSMNSGSKNNKILLWSALILILCFLLFFTAKMLRETNKKSDDHL